MKKKKLILAVLAIALAISAIVIPSTTAFALPSNGVISQDRYSGIPGASWQVVGNNFIKYNYYGPGALLSRYFMTSGASTYACYPISSPISVFNGETWQQPATLQPNWTSVMGGSYTLNSPIGAYGTAIAFRNSPDGAVTSYGTITADYSTLFLAYATMFEYGYQGSKDQGSAFGLGTDGPGQAARYYATNMAFQRISGQAQSKSDGGYFSMSGVPPQNVGVIQFEWYLEQKARHILCTPTPFFGDLQGSFGTPARVDSTTVSIPVSVKIPDPTQAAYYSYNTDFAWTNLSTLSRQNQAAVTSTMSSFANGNGTSVSANLLVDSASINGGEHLSFVVTGKAKSIQTEAQIYLTNEGPGNSSTFMLRDETTGNTSNTTYLNTVSTDTTLPLFDVQTTGITANASYNAGDTGTVSVVYKNNSSLSAVNVPVSLASSSSLGTPFTISNANQTIGELLPGVSTTVTYNITANTLSGNATATFTAKIGYNPDGSTRFNETNYSNNTLTKTTVVNSLPDLIVSSLTTDKSTYEAGETVTVTTVAANVGNIPVSSTAMKLEISGIGTQSKAVSSLAANGGTRTVTFTFTAPIAINNQTITLKATIDPDNVIAESNESNNTKTSTCIVNALRPDVTIMNTTVQNWYAGKDVVVSATVKNLTAQPVPSVTVRFSMGGIVMNTSVPVAGNGSNLAVFRFTVPEAGTYLVTFTADPSGALEESNESNNIWNGQVTVMDVPVSTVLDPDDTGTEQQYRVYGLKALPSTSNSDYHTWQETRLENGSYVTKNFWAQLTTAFAVSPDSRIAVAGQPDVMESGFGVQAQCITTLTSNYDRPEDLIGPQMVWTMYPESGYGQTAKRQNVRDSMEAASGQAGAWSVTWQYAVNPYSQAGARLHYTPIWFPDGQYTALVQAFYAWSPVGQLYNYTTDGVTISGDMYDRITTVGR